MITERQPGSDFSPSRRQRWKSSQSHRGLTDASGAADCQIQRGRRNNVQIFKFERRGSPTTALVGSLQSPAQYALWEQISAAQQEGPHSADELFLGHLHAQVRLGLLEIELRDHKDVHNRGNLLNRALLNAVREENLEDLLVEDTRPSPHLKKFRPASPQPPP